MCIQGRACVLMVVCTLPGVCMASIGGESHCLPVVGPTHGGGSLGYAGSEIWRAPSRGRVRPERGIKSALGPSAEHS